MGYAFISYSDKQIEKARTLRDILKANGIQTWLAKDDIPPSRDFAEEIDIAIEGCSCWVLLLTNDSMNSPHVKREVNLAISYGKPLFSIKLDDVVLNRSFKYYLGVSQIIKIEKIDLSSKDFRKLLSAISVCVNGEPDAKSDAPSPEAAKPSMGVSESNVRNPYKRYDTEAARPSMGVSEYNVRNPYKRYDTEASRPAGGTKDVGYVPEYSIPLSMLKGPFDEQTESAPSWFYDSLFGSTKQTDAEQPAVQSSPYSPDPYSSSDPVYKPLYNPVSDLSADNYRVPSAKRRRRPSADADKASGEPSLADSQLTSPPDTAQRRYSYDADDRITTSRSSDSRIPSFLKRKK